MNGTVPEFQKFGIQDKIIGFIKLLRPKQWIKNLFVFAAIAFSKNIFNADAFMKVLLAFFAFCMVSSCIYILNDIVDMEKDRQHPRKRKRPIAAGIVSRLEAGFIMVILAPLSLVPSFLLDPVFGVIILVYILNNVLYSLKIKHVVILDVMSIALGFLLRVSGGAVVIDVEMSPWLLLCTLLLSLFLGFSKRRNELFILEGNADKHRKILEEYSLQFIDNMLSIVTASTVMAYSLYTFSAHSNKYMMITIPFILYGIFRYQYIVYKKNEGGSPDEIVLSDKPLIINILLWITSSIIIIYAVK